MIRLQENVPEIYIKESRDFQLFCRLYDCIINGVKYDIDTMIDIFDPFKANDRMLELLCTKVGFFHKKNIDTFALRYILSAFPYLTKYKGTKKGIEGAVSVILKINQVYTNVTVEIDSTQGLVDIKVEEYINLEYLDELMEYILPPGYLYQVQYVIPQETSTILESVNLVYNTMSTSEYTSEIATISSYNEVSTALPTYEVQLADASDNIGRTEQEIEKDGIKGNQTTIVYMTTRDGESVKLKATIWVPYTDINNSLHTIERQEVVGTINTLKDKDNTTKELFEQGDDK